VKKVLLVIRLLAEAMLGLICMMIASPQQFTLVVLGYLGMPRRYHPAELQRFHIALALGDFLWVTIVLLIGALCFTDVFKMIRKLRLSYLES
jgi:heme/copper-type cytochrome/quinol oxidase subunit 1